MPRGKGICGTAPPPKGAKRASAQRRSLLFCRDAVFTHRTSTAPQGLPLSGGAGPSPTPQRKRAVGGPGDSLPPAGGTAYVSAGATSAPFPRRLFSEKHRPLHWDDADYGAPFLGGTEPFPPSQKGVDWQPQTIFSRLSRQEGLLLWQVRPRPVFFADRSLRETPPRIGAMPSLEAPSFQPIQGLCHRHREGQPTAPNGALSPAGGTTYCFSRFGLGPVPAPTGRGRVHPSSLSGRSRRSPGRETGCHTAPGGGGPVRERGIPLPQGTALLFGIPPASLEPARQAAGSAELFSPFDRQGNRPVLPVEKGADCELAICGLLPSARRARPATGSLPQAATRHLVRCGNT